MKLPKEKVERIVSKERTRRVLHHVNLAIEETKKGRGKTKRVERQGWLEATDSYRLVRVPVEIDESDAPGLIHTLAIEAARKAKVDDIAVNGAATVEVDGGQLTLDSPAGAYPELANLIPTGDPVFSIGLNAELLAGLAKALNTKDGRGVRLDFYGPIKPIRVTPLNNKERGAIGVCMPVRLAG